MHVDARVPEIRLKEKHFTNFGGYPCAPDEQMAADDQGTQAIAAALRDCTWSRCADSFFHIIMNVLMIRYTGQPICTVPYTPVHSLDPSAKQLPVASFRSLAIVPEGK